MATAYWTGGLDDGTLSADPHNWTTDPTLQNDYAPATDDDLIFDHTIPAYLAPAVNYDDSFDGMTFGDITANDGSNCLDGGMSCDALVLIGASSAGLLNHSGSCSSLIAGADGSTCNFWALCTGAAAFAGGSNNSNAVGDHSSFRDLSINAGQTGDDCAFFDQAVDLGSHSGVVAYNDNSVAYNAYSAGTILVRDAAQLDGVSSDLIDWYSSGSIEDEYEQFSASVSAYTPLNAELNNGSILRVTLMTTGASVNSDCSGGSEVLVMVDSINIAAANIRGGVSMLGVIGSLTAPTATAQYRNGGSSGY